MIIKNKNPEIKWLKVIAIFPISRFYKRGTFRKIEINPFNLV